MKPVTQGNVAALGAGGFEVFSRLNPRRLPPFDHSNRSHRPRRYRPQFAAVMLSCSTVAIDTQMKYGT